MVTCGVMRNNSRSATRTFLNPRLIPVIIASAYLLSVLHYFGVACFYNWELEWQTAFILWTAAVGLWLGSWWSKLVAIALSGFLLYRFILFALKVHGVVVISPDEEGGWPPPELWWGFVLRSPWDIIPLVLATFILIYSAISLGMGIYRRRSVLP